MDLSIVIVNWNSGSYLLRLLDSLKPLKAELDEIVVVDNGSADSSVSAVSEDTKVKLIQLEGNQGFARAANIGIGATDSLYVLLLNPDIKIVPGTLRNLCEEMSKRPSLGIACPALVDEEGKSQESFQIRPFPTMFSVITDALFVEEVLRLFRRVQSNQLRETSEVDQPAAAFWLMRRAGWKQIAGFDERFFPAWFEDVDFCKRLLAEGWMIMYFPEWQAIHRGGISLEHLTYHKFIEIYYSNLLRYWKKHHRRSYPLVWLPVRFGIFVRRLFAR